MKEKVSILIDENLKIIQFNQELQEIIRGNVSQEALRLKEENQVLKDCNKRLEESCKSVKTSQNFDQVLEKKQFNMELENYLKELQDENMRLKNTLFEVLNS
jgi:predicted RNase H-like nuclease (RuvC/YqgF family)